jgi:hypothetical protein
MLLALLLQPITPLLVAGEEAEVEEVAVDLLAITFHRVKFVNQK